MEASMQVIDVVVRWSGTVVAVERLARGERFTVGAAAAAERHFVWHHPELLAAAHPVVEHREDGVRVSALPGAVLVVDGARQDVRELTLGAAQRARVVLGAIEIETRPSARSKTAPVARERDARFLRMSGTALIMHAGFVCALLLTRQQPNLDAELPAHVRLVADAWALRPPPAPTALRPAAEEVTQSPRLDAIRPVRSTARATGATPVKDARSLALAALSAMGLDGAGVSSAFGASGPALGGGLRGAPGGAGGDGGIGVRRGGFGVTTATLQVGSLGPLGDGDDEPAYVGLPAKERVPVRVIADRFDHQDGLTRDEIARVMDRARSQVKACYERELGAEPDLQGKVVMAFTIAGSGDVAVAHAAQNTLRGAGGGRVGGCVERVVSRLHFPKPRGGGVVQVTYPFVLAVSGG
jgi:hypothetical protein